MPNVPKCQMCDRPRSVADAAHPMDAYDYSPLQAVTGQPFGWYSGSDGEMCPECFTDVMKG